MKIAVLAPLWFTIPPKGYGGTERVVELLVQGYCELGHEVYLLAVKGSMCPPNCTLVEVLDKGMYEYIDGFNFKSIENYEFMAYAKLGELLQTEKIDVVHNHMGIHPIALTRFINTPFYTTYHSSIAPDFPVLAKEFVDANYISVSNAQRSVAPEMNWVSTISNPIDMNKFQPRAAENNGDYLFFIGSLSKDKGLDIAVELALNTDSKLKIAGKFQDAAGEEWFNSEIKPHIDGVNIEFIGEVNDEEKKELYSNASALVFPSRWNEAFGLVAIEAMASGVPVIGSNMGAIPEIVQNGINGFVCKDMNEYVNAVNSLKELDASKIVQYTKDNYDYKQISMQYIELFQSTI